MKTYNINEYVDIPAEAVEWLEKNVFPAPLSSVKRPDLERGLLLYHLCVKHNAKRCLDIGTAGGFSAKCMAYSGAEIDTVDIKGENRKNGNITYHVGQSQMLVPSLEAEGARYDVCFVDGDHTYEGTKKDIENCKRICKIIVAHDYRNLPDVTKAIDEAMQPDEFILDDRMWKGAPYENGIDRHGKKIDYGIAVKYII